VPGCRGDGIVEAVPPLPAKRKGHGVTRVIRALLIGHIALVADAIRLLLRGDNP
jgi:hypothetical protein